MTVGELKVRLIEDFGQDVSIEDFIGAICLMIEADKAQYVQGAPDGELPHPLVVRCLDAALQHLHDASLAYYASLK
jgi:hypothetical protein